jgi:hypothetical protein
MSNEAKRKEEKREEWGKELKRREKKTKRERVGDMKDMKHDKSFVDGEA